MVCAASKALAECAERVRSKFSAKGFKSAKTFALPLKAQNLQNRLAPEGPDPKTPFWTHKSSESSKLFKNVRSLRMLGVEYAQPIPHVEGHYARVEMNLESPSTSRHAD